MEDRLGSVSAKRKKREGENVGIKFLFLFSVDRRGEGGV